MTRELLNKFLNNSCTEIELQEVLQWLRQKTDSELKRKLVWDDWADYKEENFADDERFLSLFDKIQAEIERKETEDRYHKPTRTILFTRWLMRVASVLLIPISVFLYYTLSENKSLSNQFVSASVDSLEIIAPIGSRSVIQLSDGSVVHLNFGSRLKYPHYFIGDKREVKLEGEGFFEVAHNPKKPFVVNAGKMNVKALGTVFNVMAYKEDNTVQTTLVEGKVVLETEESGAEAKVLGTMVPNQNVIYNTKDGSVSSSKGNIEKYISWKDGKLIFEDTPINEVAEKLSRMFSVDIQVDKDIGDQVYTVTLIDEPLFQILDLMTIATPVQYEIFPRKKLNDGTYSKQKILIKKK